jgi:phosphoesterase RecJ-like protein
MGPAMSDEPALDQIRELIEGSRHLLIVTHVAPDGDAIGSLLGLGWLLKALGKSLTQACEDPVPETYTWLPGSDEVARRGSGSYDLVIGLDCSDQRRMGRVFEDEFLGLPLINIDHHITNTRFGTVNWVDPSAAAAAQMILTMAEALGWGVTQPAALCLLNGLVTDTRGFRTGNVSPAVLRAALRLMNAGAALNEITWRVLDQRPLASVQLWGEAIEELHLEDEILWTVVTRAMRKRWGSTNGEDGYSGLANFLAGVREAKVTVVFTERNDGTIDVGMRSIPGCDVSQAAVRLGGGGHPQAAGCTLEGELGAAEARVLDEIRRSLAEQRMAAARCSGERSRVSPPG